jgi:MocE subfamily Rieske [2Fe-2S] domain protein
MPDHVHVIPQPVRKLDYSLVGVNSKLAVERGLAEAEWYQCSVPHGTMRLLLERRNGPAIRNTMLWLGLLFGSGVATYALWGSWWAVLPYALYSVLYASTSDSRWHEAGHGTAFKTDWMNNGLYELASFMVMRESVVWRWSHTRHHSDTIIVGRDPEVAVPRPPDIRGMLLSLFNLPTYPKYLRHIVLHSFGRMSAEEETFIPEDQFGKVFGRARIYVGIYLAVVALAIYSRSVLPLMLAGLTNIFGTWLMIVYGYTQHAGLAEDVLDHRLNCRTVYMNSVNRFLYWNMNYHVEHHMFPLVPFHALPQLHEAIKDDCPPAYRGLLAAWREILPTILKQVKDPAYHVKRRLPESKSRPHDAALRHEGNADAEGWVPVCAASTLGRADVLRFDYGRKTFAVYRDECGKLYSTDGICTHGNVHLSGGLVKGSIIECPKHNGRFNLSDGSPARAPICRGLATYPVEERHGTLHLNVSHPGGAGARGQKTYRLRVLSNRSVSTFIKELVLTPVDEAEKIAFTPGDYLQIDIPPYDNIRFRTFDIPEPFAAVWRNQHVFDLVARNPKGGSRNNYSLASNPHRENTLRFNIRIATPPPGQDCPPGVGSSYVFSLKEGDEVTAIGPFGDFHIKPTLREMIYIGGGAGMAPLRAHLSHLLETEKTARKVSFWYGARSRQELFYDDYFEQLAAEHKNFAFNVVLSSPLPQDGWAGHRGFVHDVLREQYLASHADPQRAEYYLCGPPMMIKACTRMLHELGVQGSHISFDEF